MLFDPADVSIHSIQDGKKMLSLPIGVKYLPQASKQAAVTGIWWLKNDQPIAQKSIPDIFKRNGLIVRIRSV